MHEKHDIYLLLHCSTQIW